MKKRMYCIVLVFILLFGNILIVEAKYYDDLDVETLGVEYRDAVNYMSDNGYMVGTTDTTFLPEKEMTRAMVVTVLYSMEKKKHEAETNTQPTFDKDILFEDVSESAWYYDAVCWANHNNIVSGKSETVFDPGGKVTKAQFAVILRAYASYKNYSLEITNDTDITGAEDYASISSYARTAMQWMVDKHIYTMDTVTSKLNPGNKIARKDAALCIVRFGELVEGFNFKCDTLPFVNSRTYFTNEDITAYYLTEEDWDDLEDRVREACEELKGTDRVNVEQLIRYINNYQKKMGWSGSCYGMAMVVALDKIGKIGFNENLVGTIESMSEVPQPINQLDVLSRINYYQLSQFIPQIQNRPFRYGGTGEEDLSAGYKQLIEEVKNNGIVQLSYYWPKKVGTGSNGHCVIAYRCVLNQSGNYELWTYNPNSTSVYKYIIDDEYNCTTLNALGVTRIRFRSDLSVYDMCDYDGKYNDVDYDGAEENGTTAIVIIPLEQGDFVLTNAAGQKISYDSKNITFAGDIEIVDEQLTTDTLMLYIKESESFLFEVVDDVCKFSMLGQEVYADVEGSNIKSVLIENNATIQLAGDNMDYSVIIETTGEDGKSLEVSDTASGIVTIDGNN